MMRTQLSLSQVGLALLCISSLTTTTTVDAFSVEPLPTVTPVSSTSTTLSARRGKGGLTGGGASKNKLKKDAFIWYTIPATTKDLPKDSNTIAVIDTELQSLKNGQTNPTGAVCVGTHNSQTYSFQVNCPSCQIPLTKAKIVDANDSDILVCDFCKSSFDLKDNGKQLEESVESNPGLFGSLAKNLFSANKEKTDLKMYNLGDKNGKLVLGFPNLE